MSSSQSNTQSSNANHNFSWKFDTIDAWRHESQDDSPNPQYSIQGGKLTIFTRANSKDRQKMRTLAKHFTSGTYQWRTHIPSIRTSDQVSIGCFLYCDDRHELDFEIGYGKTSKREEMHISQEDQLIVYMTCQGFPYTSECVAINPGWHDFAIRLDLANGKYLASWLIDGELKNQKSLDFGNEISFMIFCSVENLEFLGDELPKNNTQAIFEFVTFNGQTQ